MFCVFFFFVLTCVPAVQNDVLTVPLTFWFIPTVEKIPVDIVVVLAIIFYRSTENLLSNTVFPTQSRLKKKNHSDA